MSIPSNNFNIDSRFYKQQLDSLIINLTKVVAIEYAIPVNPDAKEIVRKILLDRSFQLLDENNEKFIDEYKKNIINKIKSGNNEYKDSYELLKLLGQI